MLLRRLCFIAATAHAFVLPPAPRTTRLQMMPPKPGDMTPESMRQAADALKTLKPDQIQQMLKEVEDMSPEERERLKGMGINPDMLKMSMKVHEPCGHETFTASTPSAQHLSNEK